jgi:hypothetical protein
MVTSMNDACGRPRERCPRCDRLAAPVRPHPDDVRRSQVITVVPRRAAIAAPAPPPPPPALPDPPLAPLPSVPDGFRISRALGMQHTYVLRKVGSSLRTSFAAKGDDLAVVLAREIALLRGEHSITRDDDDDEEDGALEGERRPAGETSETKRIHPRALPPDHPDAIAWRERIRAAVNRQYERRRREAEESVDQQARRAS